MCEHGYEHEHIGHEHISHHPHHMHEYHGYREPLTKEEELKILEEGKKKMQSELTRVEQRMEELKEEA